MVISRPDKGAVFISYAHRDGGVPADWADGILRAAGIPVWRDARDLNTGTTDDDIRQEIAMCAEGLVILTDHYPNSGFAYPKEFAQFVSQRNDVGWKFTIDHSIRDENGGLDVDGPDRLLDGGPFESTNQVDLRDETSARAYVDRLVGNRLRTVLPAGSAQTLRLHINSYVREVAEQAPDHGLFINIDLNNGLTQTEGLTHLAWALPVTSRWLGRFRAPETPPTILVTGGAHPSVAVAVGAALSVTRYRGEVWVQAKESSLWLDPEVPDPGESHVDPKTDIKVCWDDTQRGPLAVFVNFANREGNPAFDELWTAIRGDIAKAIRIDRTGPEGHMSIAPGEGRRLAEEAASVIRRHADNQDTDVIHLCVAAAFPIALHLGRLLNNYTVHLWERGASNEGPRYRRTLTIDGDGEIIQAHAEPSDPAKPPSYR